MKKSPAAISIYFHQKLLIIKKLDSFKNIRCYIWIPWVKMHIGTKFYYCSIYRTWVIKKNRISIFLRKGLWLQTKYFFSQKLLRVGVSNHQRFLLLYVSVCTVKEKQIKNFWYHFFHFLDVLIWTDSITQTRTLLVGVHGSTPHSNHETANYGSILLPER